MKRVLTKFIAMSSIALLMLASCKKEGTLVKSDGGKPGELSASTATPDLDRTKISDTTKVIRFNVTSPVYSFKAAATNTLQIDAADDNWANPSTFTLGKGVLSQGFSIADFNALLLKLNLPADIPAQVNVRIAHSLSTATAPLYSNVISITATPFNLTSFVYLPGAYEGWANPGPQEDSLVSVTGNGVYVGVVNFTAGNRDFLIVPKKGSWDNKWATTDGATADAKNATYSTEYVTGGGNNFFAPTTPGQYYITFNSNTNVLTMSPVNYYSVIGNAPPGQDWNTDTDLKYVSGDQAWEAIIPMVAGEFKVRQNHDWGISYGIPKPGTEGDGVDASLNNTTNNNIPITTAGNYKVKFIIPLTVVGASGADGPPVTATYSVVKQ